MKKKRSISIINTQMQLINSLEAVNHYKSEDNWLIIGNLMENRNNQIKTFYRQYNLKNYFSHYINLRLINSDSDFGIIVNTIYSKIILTFILYIREYNYVFIGHYLNSFHRYTIRLANKNYKYCKNVLVDDGTGTMLFSKVRTDEYKYNTDLCVYTRLSKLLFAPKSFNNAFPKNIEYFSIYPIEHLLNNDTLVNNNYGKIRSWKKTNNLHTTANTMIIVGQTLVEEKILSKDIYIRYLEYSIQKAKTNYNIESVIYCPHPGESDIQRKLSSINDIKIHQNKDPFELFALTLPKTCIITGFFSSSLWNLTFLGIEASLKYIYIKEDDIQCGEPMKSHIVNIYRTYSSNNTIKII